MNEITESPQFELHKFSSQYPEYLQGVAKMHSEALELEIAELEVEAKQIQDEIMELTGKNSVMD